MIVGAAGALFSLDVWEAGESAAAFGIALPEAGRSATVAAGTVLRIGPRRWWLDGSGFAPDFLAKALHGSGVVTPVGGGWVRVGLSGAGWRDLIMTSGLIDAEDPNFGPGSVAVTPLHHARCVIHVRAASLCEVFVPASYADHCVSAWRDMGWQHIAA